jgi:AcrR family transcriptional regulator
MSVKGLARREAILDAAVGLLLDRDVRGLTMDSVARRAGISKGGLTHHFPSNEKLIEGTCARMIQVFEAKVAELSDGAACGTRAELEAYIAASLDSPFRGLAAELGAGVAAALGRDPVKNDRLVDPLRRLYQGILEANRRRRRGARFARAAILFMAVEAVLFFDIFRLCEFTEPEMELIKAELIRLAGGLGPEAAGARA